jgi:hypothetical protein
MWLPVDIDINIADIRSLEVYNIHPKPIPKGVTIENIRTIKTPVLYSIPFLYNYIPNVKDSTHLWRLTAITKFTNELNSFYQINLLILIVQ